MKHRPFFEPPDVSRAVRTLRLRGGLRSLLNAATMVFYDGAPDYPDAGRLWQLVERHRVTHLGVSPTLIRTLKPLDVEPIRRADVASLRMIGSTGSPWDPESWLWLFLFVGVGGGFGGGAPPPKPLLLTQTDRFTPPPT